MIKFKGSQKAFFKAYPRDRRSFDEVYCLTSYNLITKQVTVQCYKFIGTLGEKNFKKVEMPIEHEATSACDDVKSETASDCGDIEYRLSSIEDKLSALAIENARLNNELEHTKARLQELLYDFGALCTVVYIMDDYLNDEMKNWSYDRNETFIKGCIYQHIFHTILQIPRDRSFLYLKTDFLTWLKQKGMFNENNPILTGNGSK